MAGWFCTSTMLYQPESAVLNRCFPFDLETQLAVSRGLSNSILILCTLDGGRIERYWFESGLQRKYEHYNCYQH